MLAAQRVALNILAGQFFVEELKMLKLEAFAFELPRSSRLIRI